MRTIFRLLLTVMFAGSFSAAYADDGYLNLGAGWFDFERADDYSANFSAEWRGKTFYYDLRPVAGVAVNKNAGVYAYGGFDYDWQFAPQWYLTPGLAIGAWRQGSSIDLGGTFEFHESLEVSYKLGNDYRIGAEISHTSNAGIYDSNPGVNTLMATLSLPL